MHAELLTPAQLARVHDASLDILENIGLLVRNLRAQEIFRAQGLPFADDGETVKLPRAVVENALHCVPLTFTFIAREQKYDRTLPDDRPVIMTASSAPNLLDPLTGQERRAYSDDIARIARLVQTLDGYDAFSVATLAEDAPLDQFTVTRLYPALKNCLKPLRVSASSADDVRQIIQLGFLAAGSETAYRERPFITHHYCPIVSPLTFDLDSTGELIYLCEQNLPSYATIVPNGGMSSPYTLLGTLVQANAEFLAYTTLTQMIRPGKPLIYSTLPTLADLRRGNYAPGSIENGMLVMGAAQLARYYNVPSAGYVGLTNAKLNDAQSGYEAGMSNVAALLAGCDLFSMGGLLDALMCFDFGKAVIDAEIGLMLKRLARGLEFSEENLSLDVIAETGPAGMFIDKAQTYALMKETMLIPDIADREPRQRWQKLGGLDAQSRALKRVRELFAHDHASLLDTDADTQIRVTFQNLPRGECLALNI
ncbi:MAG TPA: trimethylamine methyltransferase family protein [Anaerolineae bacterium]|nr:trimethylamine methyltransferase family protein [Anaerolineae bacterium]